MFDYILCTLLGAALVSVPMLVVGVWAKSIAMLYYTVSRAEEEKTEEKRGGKKHASEKSAA